MLKDSNMQHSSVAENTAESTVEQDLSLVRQVIPWRDIKITQTFSNTVQSTYLLAVGGGEAGAGEQRPHDC